MRSVQLRFAFRHFPALARPLVLVLVLVVAALPGCSARFDRGVDGRVFTGVTPSDVARVELTLAAGAETVLETRNPSWGAAPVLHLWDVQTRREVARDCACDGWPGCSARVRYRNPERSARRYLLVAHARDDRGGGTLDLLRDGRVLQRGVRVAGAQLAVAHGPGFVYQAAAGPGGAAQASLYALDRSGRLLAFDDDGGPLGLPRLAGSADVRRLIVARRGGAASGSGASRLRVYANDPEDGDGDGLGRALERALGTCDGVQLPACARGPLARYYTSVHNATADGDRDALDDGDELLGVGPPRKLDLPRWGADPRHKDVFVEVDYGKELVPGALSPRDIAGIAALFARGSARSLRNPDGLPAVRLHLDVGFAPERPAQLGLFGDFGGSNTVPRGDYKRARARDFSPQRRGYFRYALLTRGGTGQSTGDAFTINRDRARVPLFAHELGHTLGLRHHGDDGWGQLNCKPNYRSVMGYSYQNREEVGFSLRADAPLNGSRMLERVPVDGAFGKLLSGPPHELDVVPGVGVDWNRDGVLEREAVRAAPTWATYKSCAATGAGRTTLAEAVAAVTPALLRIGGRLYALWTDESGAAWSRASDVSLADADGSCPLGDRPTTTCAPWSQPALLAGLAGAHALAVLPLSSERAGFAYLDAAGLVQLSALVVHGALELYTPVTVSELTSDRPPALARMRTDPRFYGASEALSVFFRAAGTQSGAIMQASATSLAGPFDVRPLLDQDGRPIESPLGPTVLSLGTGELCAVFADAERFIRFYCYEPSRDRWRDLSMRAFYAGLGPQTGAEVALAYHRYRGADGLPLNGDDSRGALYLAFSEPAPGTSKPPDNPNLLISQWLSAEHGAAERIDFRWRGRAIDEWTHLGQGTAVALYEDEALSALKAAFVARNKAALLLDFLPLADGSFDAELRSGDDFEVMERGICLGLRDAQRCGDATTAAH